MNQFRLPLNKNIIISNKKTFWEKLIQMKKDGGQALQVLLIISSELQVISDFDYTLSTFYLEGTERNPSCHGILERCPFFPDDYRAKTKRLQVGYWLLLLGVGRILSYRDWSNVIILILFHL